MYFCLIGGCLTTGTHSYGVGTFSAPWPRAPIAPLRHLLRNSSSRALFRVRRRKRLTDRNKRMCSFSIVRANTFFVTVVVGRKRRLGFHAIPPLLVCGVTGVRENGALNSFRGQWFRANKTFKHTLVWRSTSEYTSGVLIVRSDGTRDLYIIPVCIRIRS